MPCRSDYMEPNDYEVRIKETVELIDYVEDCLRKEKNSKVLKDKAVKEVLHLNEIYFNKKDGDYFVAKLCKMMHSMTKKQIEKIAYNAKDATSRRLATWWEEHQEEDRKREAEEKANKAEAATKKRALKKLTPKERKALGL